MYTKTHVQNKTGFIEILEHVHNLDIINLPCRTLAIKVYKLLSPIKIPILL